MRQIAVFATAFVLGAGSMLAADPELLTLTPPDAAFYAGINVQQAKNSPFGQYLLSQASLPGELQQLISATGFDPRRDLNEVLIAAAVSPSGGAAGLSMDNGLVLAKGSFNIAQILSTATKEPGIKASAYAGANLVTVNDAQALAFPDSSTAIVGSLSAVTAALDRRGNPTVIDSSLMARIEQLSGSQDIWTLSGKGIGQLFPKGDAAGGIPAVLADIQQASGGAKFGTTIQITMQAVAGNQQDASSLAALVKLGAQMLGAGGPKSVQDALANVAKSLTATTDGNTLNVSVSIPEDVAESLFQFPTAGNVVI